jgi:predicted DNA binding CopG/RHH family protein
MGKPKRTKPSVPAFRDEDEERRFWAKHDVTDYFDWERAVQPSFPELKPSTASISLRLPIGMLEELKALANARDVPYQSLMKVFLAERIVRERRRGRSSG